MNTFCFYFWAASIFLFTACHADPNIIPDDEIPNGPGQPLECDSLPVPNSVFSNADGQSLIFMDKLGQNFDTVICVRNVAKEIKAEAFGQEYCQRQYTTAFSTKWMPTPDNYAVEFQNNISPRHTTLSAYSVPYEDFLAFDNRFTEVAGIYEDTLTINGKLFHQVFTYTCQSSSPCTFAESFVFSLNEGLVAIKRQGAWWTKK
ncbi:MAG: hypothetical protein K9J37_01300 [Saprospiraceae bacterium]|nr:hypothetical protein [Saprospiraceae bacterium]MCF8248512.1 hypothetical protein [Saprospiraceae bacterium]MCF8280583.1 hypothetical protein [Bacteroidales bacterium]MCF8310246.1 hypothetical protein [Saprospiraceae bacterium]MCF8439315.1 hypothetical protein [Saprospiraceae bacterium]